MNKCQSQGRIRNGIPSQYSRWAVLKRCDSKISKKVWWVVILFLQDFCVASKNANFPDEKLPIIIIAKRTKTKRLVEKNLCFKINSHHYDNFIILGIYSIRKYESFSCLFILIFPHFHFHFRIQRKKL
jgi:hypothetical protein